MIKKVVLITAVLGIFLANSVQAAISEDVVKETIIKHSIEMGVDPALALSIAKKESGFKILLTPFVAFNRNIRFQVIPSQHKLVFTKMFWVYHIFSEYLCVYY